MFLLDDTIVTSASDLTVASTCEFAFLRALDARLGRCPPPPRTADAMLKRAARLGDEHERRILDRYRAQYGSGVAEIARPESMSREAIGVAVAATERAFTAGADVVFQATFFDERVDQRSAFIGFADFIVRSGDHRYRVQDAKLARRARVTALLQLAAYAERLEAFGVRTDDTVELLLGDGTGSPHRLAHVAPVYRLRRERLARVVADRLADDCAVGWRDPRYLYCGRCEVCEAEAQEHRDVLLVAGMRMTQRAALADSGIRTIDELATTTAPVDGMPAATLEGLRAQARLQVAAEPDEPPPVEIRDPEALGLLPEPDPGDVFFDFEGDPLYTEGDSGRWNLDYLFGLVDAHGAFRAFWAHDFAAERQALIDFLAFIRDRRARHPDMHIYHYAAYERTHLLSLAARHGIGEADVDTLLREHVLVDLYTIVRRSLRVGSRSYSIKKLEPLYMGAELRDGEVTTAVDSVAEYAKARELRAVGETAEADRILEAIADYNAYDCLSTLRLRDWLSTLAHSHGVALGTGRRETDEARELGPSPVRDGLLALADSLPSDTESADRHAAALAAAAVDYHAREQKGFWWEHYARLVQPIDEWEDTRDVLVIEHASIVRDWHRESSKQKSDRRLLRLAGRWGPGSSTTAGSRARPYLLYEYPGPFPATTGDPGARSAREVTVREIDDEGVVLVEETLPRNAEPYSVVPSVLTPAAPPPVGNQQDAIAEWAKEILDARPAWPHDPMTDVLRRRPPRTRTGRLAPAAADTELVPAVVASVRDLDHSYLAVQGPPGTGKTYLAAHVLTALVREHHWRIGVVAQSHRVVENLLTETVVSAGLDRHLVGKAPQTGDTRSEAAFTLLPAGGQPRFTADHALSGFVVGGTAWDFSNPARVPRRSLDLLVVDEAGQFSLASTIAASVSAANLLLLGDPQQLPQVSKGTHPEPIDESALGWIANGHDVLPADLGYFLPESRRMHAAVAEAVSRLSYDGRLHAHPSAARRSLAGVTPGLTARPVPHTGNATSSAEEAEEVVGIVHDVVGRAWTDPADDRTATPLRPEDVIVVTPYNAQVALVREALDAAGLPSVRVGTVDRFQGQEAVIAIVTLAASSPADVPRGMSFLIMTNRLNVAISRAKWAAYLVYSPALTGYLPATPDGVAELSAFLALVS